MNTIFTICKLLIGIFRTEGFFVKRASQIWNIGPSPLNIYLDTVIQIHQVMVASGPKITKLVNYPPLSPVTPLSDNYSNWQYSFWQILLVIFWGSSLYFILFSPLIRELSSATLVKYLTHQAVWWWLCHCRGILFLKVFLYFSLIGKSTGMILT